MIGSSYADIDFDKIKRVSDSGAAILFVLEDDDEPNEHWIPTSLIDQDWLDGDRESPVRVIEWFAEKEGLI